MSPAASRPHPAGTPASRPRPRSQARRTPPRRRPAPALLWRSALEGAAASLCAVTAMLFLSALALSLVNAGSVGSTRSLALAVTAMAVGGAVSAHSTASSTASQATGMGGMFGGGMSPTVSGAVDLMPLGVTLLGTLVLWFVFSRRLPQLSENELAVRIAGTVTAASISLTIVAGLASGTLKLPKSAMSGLGAGGSATGTTGGGSPLSGLLGSGANGLAVGYHVDPVSAMFGSVLWLTVVLTVGCLISRRVRLQLGGLLDRLRPHWAPGLSALLRTLLILGAAPLLVFTLVGIVAGGRVQTAAGAALLLAPNAVIVLLTLGLGSPWTASTHPASPQGGNPMAGMMGGTGGSPFAGQHDRTLHLDSLTTAGWPLWLAALAVALVALLGCAAVAARTGSTTRPRKPRQDLLAGPLGLPIKFSVTTAAVLGAVAWMAAGQVHLSLGLFGMQMGGIRAGVSDNVLWTITAALLMGALAGWAGPVLQTKFLPKGRIRSAREPGVGA
ncbi:streptophobe family protein [Streptacidiphilus sp. N1-10]|uniref:Streptophobe family protein n=1 Tax=Streptacidiphilus jeojiensis TaxID=3229225 RepID=A0ABV6XVZ0_9ACTN